jgi:hypothetical protein
MKFSRLHNATTAAQRPVREDARRARPNAGGDDGGRLAHRYLALRALRQLARGHYLVVAGDTSLGVRLEGAPDAVHLVDDFLAGGLVRQIRSEKGVRWYAITDFGRDTLRRGEAWWATLTAMERLQVRFGG